MGLQHSLGSCAETSHLYKSSVLHTYCINAFINNGSEQQKPINYFTQGVPTSDVHFGENRAFVASRSVRINDKIRNE
jgi:hypothetical protein